ncbi:MAG TPA: pyruvate dehydrogenase complex dihydrolipoamide acetyltransferase [Lacunisphaera sp.]
MADIIEMPKLSDTMTVGTLVKWLKKEGDAVKAGDMLAEVETDKATMELESFFTGTLVKIFAPAGSQVAIGAGLCAIGKAGETVEAPAAPAPKASSGAAATTPQAAATVEKKLEAEATPAAAPSVSTPPKAQTEGGSKKEADVLPPPAPGASGERLKISPLAKKIAAQQSIDANRITGTGPHGRIVKADVLAAAADPTKLKAAAAAGAGAPSPRSAAPAFTGGAISAKGPVQEERLAPVSTMRGVIAKRMVESTTTIPYVYLDIEIDAEPLLAIRAQLNSGLEKEGVKLSVNDFVIKASAEALRRVPTVNCSWEGTHIRHHGAAHVAFAVALEDGLITPVVKDAHLKSVFQISTEAKALGKKAKDKKLAPADYTGGTFCVSNLGMMGIPKFTAIINPPNAAILAVGTTVAKPVVKNGQIVPGQTMTMTLSCDHRVFDGAVGAQYLGALKDLLEKPALLLV